MTCKSCQALKARVSALEKAVDLLNTHGHAGPAGPIGEPLVLIDEGLQPLKGLIQAREGADG